MRRFIVHITILILFICSQMSCSSMMDDQDDMSPLSLMQKWSFNAYIKAGNSGTGDTFARGLSISGDTIAVGVYSEDSDQTGITNGPAGPYGTDDGSHNNSGAVYIYRRTGNRWTQEAYIKAGNNGAGDWLGIAVALSGDLLAVGATWEDSDQDFITNGFDDFYGTDDGAHDESGAAYVYIRDKSNQWIQDAYIKTGNNGADDRFGNRIAIDGRTLAVSAWYESSIGTEIIHSNEGPYGIDDDLYRSGAVYMYRR